ncbi:MAG: hypothetical protein ACNJA3_29055 (plasmid) [Pseudomonas rhizophila]|uniref:hypothetical protein n=1 Tax=Pseudomonas rhizophila TaxID=2045200 RepID=UPI003F6D7601
MNDNDQSVCAPGTDFYKGLVKHATFEPFKGIVEFVLTQPSILTGLPPGRSFGQFEPMKALNVEEQIFIWRKRDGWQVEVGIFSKDASSFAGDVSDEALETFYASTRSPI